MSASATVSTLRTADLPQTVAPAPVIPLPKRLQPRRPATAWVAVVLALALAASPLTSGYFDVSASGPLALGAVVLAAVLAAIAGPALTRPGAIAAAGLGLLLALTASSMLWAESKESAWTAVDRLGLYCAVFAIVVLAVRERRVGRAIVLILGSAALASSLWLCASFVLGGGQGAFVAHRLSAPIGYINGTAGLLVMGLWPWIALSETATRRSIRAAALAAAALIAGTFVLTQSRAVIPATVISAAVVLLCAPERVRRAVNLIIVGLALAATLPWTLAVYAANSASPPGHGVLRAAAVSIFAASIGAGAARYAVAMLGSRVRSGAIRRLGVALLTLAAAGGIAGAVVGGPWLARQYRSFVALHVDPNAPVRFLDAGGFRYDLWRVAVREFRAHPIGGVGAGNYDVEYYRLRNNPEYVLQPHSLELQMAAELGVPGLLALLAFCGAILFAAFKRRSTLASRDRLIKVAAAGTFVAWLVGTSVDWLYDIPGLAGMALVSAGLLVVPAGGVSSVGGRRRLAVRVACLALLALLAASTARQYVASRYASSGAAEVTRSPRAAIGTLRHAAQLDPYSLTTLYSLAAAYARLDDYSGAWSTLLVASRREPHNYVPPALLGDLATRRGDRGLAATEYARALQLNPRDPQLMQSELRAREAER
jgi:O-antigen ligase